MRIRKLVVALFLLVAIVSASWWAFTAYHRYRAQKLVAILQKISTTGAFDPSEINGFYTIKTCDDSRCSYSFTESNYSWRLLDFFSHHEFPKWPAIFFVQGEVGVSNKGGVLGSRLRLSDDVGTPQGTFAVAEISTAAGDPLPFQCDSATIQHPGLKIELRKGWILHASATSTLEPSIREKLFAVNWSCLGSLRGCAKSENLLPEVARILEADQEWEQSHPSEEKEILDACETIRHSR